MSPNHGHAASLPRDLQELLHRRRDVLRLLGAASLIPLLGCGTEAGALGGGDAGTASSSGTDGGTTGGSCASVPEETAGPYPGDGSNGPNALALSGVVRSDIRASLGGSSAVATGVPLGITLTGGSGLVLRAGGRRRGVPVALRCARPLLPLLVRRDRRELAPGRAGHRRRRAGALHHHLPRLLQRPVAARALQIYPSLASATASANKRATSQLALPQATCAEVYATSGYTGSAANLARVSLSTDMVFSDGATLETPTVTGSVNANYEVALTVGIVL